MLFLLSSIPTMCATLIDSVIWMDEYGGLDCRLLVLLFGFDAKFFFWWWICGLTSDNEPVDERDDCSVIWGCCGAMEGARRWTAQVPFAKAY